MCCVLMPVNEFLLLPNIQVLSDSELQMPISTDTDAYGGGMNASWIICIVMIGWMSRMMSSVN